MTNFPVDIILPVWNSPEETRSCLVNLAAYSPQARIILVDNGSERETERLLEEFAEILGDRALLVRTDTNIGFVRAANRGLARGEAEFLALVKSSTQVAAGWLDPLLSFMTSQEEAGIVTPRVAPLGTGKGGSSSVGGTREIDHPSFAALLLRKELFDEMGGFDEGMDADIWCLKDYSRRAWRTGRRAFVVATPPVLFRTDNPMGSVERRQARVAHSEALYRERWGDEQHFSVAVTAGTDAAALQDRLPLFMECARQGHLLTVFLSSRLLKELGLGKEPRHANITWSPLPYLFSTRSLKARITRLGSRSPETVFVPWQEGIDFPLPGNSMSFEEFERHINQMAHLYYGRRLPE